jgi:putative component of membrane protein insertase Oxa1/YidC/SpoIIIJ protein YidD
MQKLLSSIRGVFKTCERFFLTYSQYMLDTLLHFFRVPFSRVVRCHFLAACGFGNPQGETYQKIAGGSVIWHALCSISTVTV